MQSCLHVVESFCMMSETQNVHRHKTSKQLLLQFKWEGRGGEIKFEMILKIMQSKFAVEALMHSHSL